MLSVLIVLKCIDKIQGKQYIGKPCKHGHNSPRLAINGSCMECNRLKCAKVPAEENRRRAREYRNNNLEARKEAYKIWRAANRDKALDATDRWREQNIEKIRENVKLYLNKKYSEDISYKLRVTLRNRTHRAIKGQKVGSFVKDLGCSISQLIEYISSQFRDGMDWDNWGKIWQLDHKKPLVSFDLSNREEFLLAANYSNLEPLMIHEHRIKSVLERNHYPYFSKPERII